MMDNFDLGAVCRHASMPLLRIQKGAMRDGDDVFVQPCLLDETTEEIWAGTIENIAHLSLSVHGDGVHAS